MRVSISWRRVEPANTGNVRRRNSRSRSRSPRDAYGRMIEHIVLIVINKELNDRINGIQDLVHHHQSIRNKIIERK